MAIRLTISSCSFCASGEPTPSTWAMPNSVDGSVPASVIIEVRSSGSGSSPPRLTSSCCIIIWPRAPMARLQAERLGADLLVVDADRTVDRVLGGQQDRRVGGDAAAQVDAVGGDLVQQRLAVRRADRSTPVAHVGHDVGVGELPLQVLLAGVERAQRRPARRRRWSSPAARLRAPPCTPRSRAPSRHGRPPGADRLRRSSPSRCASRRIRRPRAAAPRRSRRLSSERANWSSPIATAASPAAAQIAVEFGGATTCGGCGERRHRAPAVQPVARRHFIDRASFIRLPAARSPTYRQAPEDPVRPAICRV